MQELIQHHKLYWLILFSSSLLFNATWTYSAEIKWKQDLYSHFSDGQSLKSILNDLMSGENIPVVVSDKIKSVVHVHLEKMSPEKILEYLARLYHFVWYYDGQSLFVYSMNELQAITLKLKHISSSKFTQAAKELAIYDHKYNWNMSESSGLIYFSGPPRLVHLVMEMAKVYDVEGIQIHQDKYIYKWSDNNGITNYSIDPPDHKQGYKLIDSITGKIVKNP